MTAPDLNERIQNGLTKLSARVQECFKPYAKSEGLIQGYLAPLLAVAFLRTADPDTSFAHRIRVQIASTMHEADTLIRSTETPNKLLLEFKHKLPWPPDDPRWESTGKSPRKQLEHYMRELSRDDPHIVAGAVVYTLKSAPDVPICAFYTLQSEVASYEVNLIEAGSDRFLPALIRMLIHPGTTARQIDEFRGKVQFFLENSPGIDSRDPDPAPPCPEASPKPTGSMRWSVRTPANGKPSRLIQETVEGHGCCNLAWRSALAALVEHYPEDWESLSFPLTNSAGTPKVMRTSGDAPKGYIPFATIGSDVLYAETALNHRGWRDLMDRSTAFRFGEQYNVD